MTERSFSEERALYTPRIPSLLYDIGQLQLHVTRQASVDWDMAHYFSSEFASKREVYTFDKEGTGKTNPTPKTVGVLFSGGQAPGGHAVISGLVDALIEYHPSSRCIGFLDGPKGLLLNRSKEIRREDALSIRHTGGFDLLGSGRDTIEGEEVLKTVLRVAEHNRLDGLVIIGGDDSNTNALYLADFFEQKGSACSLVGVPKTIDNDLKARELALTFGFDTATKTYSEIIGNIAKDTLSAKKYYFFIRLMGRHTSHITLECALKTHPNLALISEEVRHNKMSLRKVVNHLCELVEERLGQEKRYGIVLVPEGLIEHMPDVSSLIQELNEQLSTHGTLHQELLAMEDMEERYARILSLLSEKSRNTLLLFPRSLGFQLVIDRDPHGNVNVSKIETEKVLAFLVEQELIQRSKKDGKKRPFSFQTFFCGYEGRSQYPTNFDLDYSVSLGRLAGCAVIHHLNGYLVAIDQLDKEFAFWRPYCVPLLSMAVLEKRHGRTRPVIKKALVDLKSPQFLEFIQARRAWRLEDTYQQVGPIQYWRKGSFFDKPLTLAYAR